MKKRGNSWSDPLLVARSLWGLAVKLPVRVLERAVELRFLEDPCSEPQALPVLVFYV